MSVSEDLRWGTGWGVGLAFVYTLWVLVLFLLRGAEPFESKGISLGQTVVFYFVNGIISGALVGLLRPMTRTRPGGFLVGLVAAIPIVLSAGLLFFGSFSQWNPGVYLWMLLCAGMSALVGVLAFYD